METGDLPHRVMGQRTPMLTLIVTGNGKCHLSVDCKRHTIRVSSDSVL